MGEESLASNFQRSLDSVLEKNRAATRDITDRKSVCDFCYRRREEHVRNASHGLCKFLFSLKE